MAHIGDLVNKSGIYTNPGVVIEKKPDGNVVIDTEPLEINKYHRYTNTSGLTVQEKERFNSILDEIYANSEDDVAKINDIQIEVDKLKPDPHSKNIVQYLRNQQAHLIREVKQLPRMYEWDETQLRS